MFGIFKFEFMVWLDLNSIEKIKRREKKSIEIRKEVTPEFGIY